MPDTFVITSRQNPLIQDLRDRADPEVAKGLFLEGLHLVEEALKVGMPIHHLIVIPALADTELIKRAMAKAKRTTQVSAYVMKALSDVEAPQGVIAICQKPTWDWAALVSKSPAPIVILDVLQDPGNAASILRTAEAAGAAGVVTTPGTVKLFTPKALRGASGSTLRLPLLEHVAPKEIIQKLKAAGYSLLAAEGSAGTPYTEIDWRKPWGVVLGQEGAGVSSVWKGPSTQSVSIPMKAPVESLNVAAAAAIFLYASKIRN